jgi:hypothetical protein
VIGTGPHFTEQVQAEFRNATLKGNNAALRVCMERLVPPARQPNPTFKLPSIRSAADLPRASAAVVKAVAAGELSAQEAESMMRLLEIDQRLREASELAPRIDRLEQRDREAANLQLVSRADTAIPSTIGDTGSNDAQ